MVGLKGPAPEEMKPGEVYKVVKKGKDLTLEKVEEREAGSIPFPGEKHITTICGPQAEALIKYKSDGSWLNKSVPGLAVLEFWAEDDDD